MPFRAAVALPGHLGVELDVRHLSDDERRVLRDWIAIYKQLRERLHHGRVWLGEGEDELLWQAHGDEAAHDVVLIAYRPQPSSLRYAPTLRLPMLDASARYRVREVLPPGTVRSTHRHHSAAFFDAINTPDGHIVDGAWLAHAGLPMPRVQAETAFIVTLHKVA
jgi:alpha-galactosidase